MPRPLALQPEHMIPNARYVPLPGKLVPGRPPVRLPPAPRRRSRGTPAPAHRRRAHQRRRVCTAPRAPARPLAAHTRKSAGRKAGASVIPICSRSLATIPPPSAIYSNSLVGEPKNLLSRIWLAWARRRCRLPACTSRQAAGRCVPTSTTCLSRLLRRTASVTRCLRLPSPISRKRPWARGGRFPEWRLLARRYRASRRRSR